MKSYFTRDRIVALSLAAVGALTLTAGIVARAADNRPDEAPAAPVAAPVSTQTLSPDTRAACDLITSSAYGNSAEFARTVFAVRYNTEQNPELYEDRFRSLVTSMAIAINSYDSAPWLADKVAADLGTYCKAG